MMDGTVIALVSVGVTVTLAGLGAAITSVRMAWTLRGWLNDQFSVTRKLFYDTLESHEALDQKRHEDNLDRFAAIRADMARRGMNGHADH